MKYELTKETRKWCGVKLSRIRAIGDFGDVKKGDLGGWIQRENNLSQSHESAWVFDDAKIYGDARVYDNARVYGDAQVFDNAWMCGVALVSKPPINIIGLMRQITITDCHIQIGCELHKISAWEKFKDSRINAMSDDALVFWKANKHWIIQLAKAHEVAEAGK